MAQPYLIQINPEPAAPTQNPDLTRSALYNLTPEQLHGMEILASHTGNIGTILYPHSRVVFYRVNPQGAYEILRFPVILDYNEYVGAISPEDIPASREAFYEVTRDTVAEPLGKELKKYTYLVSDHEDEGVGDLLAVTSDNRDIFQAMITLATALGLPWQNVIPFEFVDGQLASYV